jgi:hypothetical protein
MFKTEQDFILPLGYQDPDGRLHREGTMRLITAKDEIEVANDPKVKRNPAYLSVLLLARVISRLGQVKVVDDEVVENFFQTDFNFLQELYNRLNQENDLNLDFKCPHCGGENHADLSALFKNFRLEEETRKTASGQISEELPAHVRA